MSYEVGQKLFSFEFSPPASLEMGCARTERMAFCECPQEYNYMDSKRIVTLLCGQPDKSTDAQERVLSLGKNLDQGKNQ